MLDLLSMPFVINAFICGILTAAACSWIGIFVTLNKMAFFSESISHASIAGIALALWFKLDPSVFLVFFSLFMASAIALVSQSSFASKDSVIGIIHTTTIAFGIIILGWLSGANSDITRYLFGDILAVRSVDIWLCVAVFIFTVAYMLAFGKKHLITSLISDFSSLEGISVKKFDFMLMMALALVISVSVKIVGAILVSALLIIPSNSARNISSSYRAFVILSIKIGVLSAILGILLSVSADLPTGPSIIVVNAAFYFLTLGLKKITGFSF